MLRAPQTSVRRLIERRIEPPLDRMTAGHRSHSDEAAAKSGAMSTMEAYKAELARLPRKGFGRRPPRARRDGGRALSQERLSHAHPATPHEIGKIEQGLVEPRLTTLLNPRGRRSRSRSTSSLAGLSVPVERRPSPRGSSGREHVRRNGRAIGARPGARGDPAADALSNAASPGSAGVPLRDNAGPLARI